MFYLETAANQNTASRLNGLRLIQPSNKEREGTPIALFYFSDAVAAR